MPSKVCKVCNGCGEEKDFALFNKNAKKKDGNVSDLFRYGKKRLMKEIEKCVILCANCHRKVHAGVIILPDRKEEGPSW